MGFEMQGVDVDVGNPAYARKASPEKHAIGMTWAKEMQTLLDAGLITTPPIRELEGRWEGIIRGLEMLQKGEVRGQKLVVRV